MLLPTYLPLTAHCASSPFLIMGSYCNIFRRTVLNLHVQCQKATPDKIFIKNYHYYHLYDNALVQSWGIIYPNAICKGTIYTGLLGITMHHLSGLIVPPDPLTSPK